MKKSILFASTALLALCLTACGGKNTENADTDTDSSYLVGSEGPLYEPCSETSEKVGDFTVSIKCQPDSANIVRDAVDTEFYDNKVTVSITRGGESVFAHTFLKSEFKGDFNPGTVILQGMAYSERKDGLFVFGAKVGDPGNDEDGTQYCVKVATDGSYTLAVDYNQNS